MPLRRLFGESLRLPGRHRALFEAALDPSRPMGLPADAARVRGALSEWSMSLVEPLLAADRPPSARCDIDAAAGAARRTPLHLAVLGGNAPAALSLVKHGASVDAKDAAGRTPLEYAVRSGFDELVDQMIDVAAAQATADRGGEEWGELWAAKRRDAAKLTSWGPRVPKNTEAVIPSTGDFGGWFEDGGDAVAVEPAPACELTEIAASEFTPALFASFISARQPLVVRGLATEWRLRHEWRKDNFLRKHGGLKFNVSSVGYAEHFGMPVDEVSAAAFIGELAPNVSRGAGTPPKYIFANDFLRKCAHCTKFYARPHQ
jgi:hypothetical protein